MPGPSVRCEDSFLFQLLRGWNRSCWKAGCISPCPDESLCLLAYWELYLSPSDGIKIIYTPCPLSQRPTHLTTTHLIFTYLLILFFLRHRLAHPSTRYHCPWITVDPYLDHPSFYGTDFPSSLLNFRATSKSGYKASLLAVPAHGVSHSTNLAFLFFLCYLNTGILCDTISVWWRRASKNQASGPPAPAVYLCLPDPLSICFEYTVSTPHWTAPSQGSGDTDVMVGNSNLVNLFFQITLEMIVSNNSDTWSP